MSVLFIFERILAKALCVNLFCTVCDLMTTFMKEQHNTLPPYIGCIPITYYGIFCLSSTCILFALSKVSPFTLNPTILRSYTFLFSSYVLPSRKQLQTVNILWSLHRWVQVWTQESRLVLLQHSKSKLHLPLIAQWPTKNFQWAIMAKQGGTTPEVSRIPQRLIANL